MACLDPPGNALSTEPLWKTILVEALEELNGHVCVKLSNTLAEEVGMLLQRTRESPANQLHGGEQLVKLLDDITLDPSVKKVKSTHLDSLCRGFQAKLTNNEHCHHLCTLAQSLGVTLHHERHISYFLLRSLLVVATRKSRPNVNLVQPTTRDLETPLSTSELQTLRYLGGYVVRQLGKRVDQETKEALDGVIEEDTTDVDVERNCFLEYTRALVNALDRGGLLQINDKFFVLLITMEKLVKSKFVMQRPDLKIIVTEALDCLEVTSLFDQAISADLTDEKRKKLKCLLIELYTNIRMNAYTKSYNFILSKHENASARKSLRHDLY